MEQSEIGLREFYEKHARSIDPTDFQSQVLRAPHGRPVGADQVDMLVDGIARGLAIKPDDVVLDLCCGNGVITDRIFERCSGGLGVDFTPYLIEVAKKNFERIPDRLYQLSDVAMYAETTDDTARFTKAYCYGAFQCLIASKAAGLLKTVRTRFPNVQCFFIGSLPDRDKASGIFGENIPPLSELTRHDTPFGTWRTEQEVAELVAGHGWSAEFWRMPSSFHSAHFRFNVTLTRS